MSNIVQLTFKSPHPADSPKYLRAIIDAYQDDLATVYEGASIVQLDALEREIDVLKKGLAGIDKELEGPRTETPRRARHQSSPASARKSYQASVRALLPIAPPSRR